MGALIAIAMLALPPSELATPAARRRGLERDPRYPLPEIPLDLPADEADGPAGETLAVALERTYRTSPLLESERYELRAVDEGLAQARSQLRPVTQVELTGGYDRLYAGDRARAERLAPRVSSSNDVLARVIVDQPIWTGGRATAAIAAATGDIRAGRAGLRATEGDVLSRVIATFVSVRRDTGIYTIRRANVVVLEATLAEITARREAGELTRTDIAQAQTQLATARVALSLAETQLAASRAAYAALTGANPDTLAPEPVLPGLPGTLDGAFTEALSTNPDLARAIEAERASRARIAVARAERSPSVSVQGSASVGGRAVPFDYDDQDHGLTGRVVVTLPLSAGGFVGSRIAQAADRNAADRLRIETARRDLVESLVNTWNQSVAFARNEELQLLQLEAARVFYDGSLQEYRAGLRSTFDVLYAQNQYREAQVGLLSTRRDRYVAQASLLRQVGRLELGSLVDGAALYDPARNTDRAMRRGALPWDGPLRALDAVGAPNLRQRPLEQLPPAAEPPRARPGAQPDYADAPVASGGLTPFPAGRNEP